METICALWLDVVRKRYSYAQKEGYSRYPYETKNIADRVAHMLQTEGYREEKES